jgi:hypothetical protein
MPTYSPVVRQHGAVAYNRANGDLKLAVKYFTSMEPKAAAQMQRPSQNLKRWALDWGDRGTYHGKRRGGRHIKVPDSRVQRCIAAMKTARRIGGVMRHYHSVKEAARHESIINSTCAEYKVDYPYLLRAMHRKDPNLTKGHEKLRRYLDKAHRKQRMRAANYLKRQPLKYRKRIFWLDAKHLYIVPPTSDVWCDAADMGSLFVEDPKHTESKPKCLNYYAMVNWFVGPVDLVWVSGTTGLTLRYKVGRPHTEHP